MQADSVRRVLSDPGPDEVHQGAVKTFDGVGVVQVWGGGGVFDAVVDAHLVEMRPHELGSSIRVDFHWCSE